MVGQLPLEQPIGVRIPGGQPKSPSEGHIPSPIRSSFPFVNFDRRILVPVLGIDPHGNPPFDGKNRIQPPVFLQNWDSERLGSREEGPDYDSVPVRMRVLISRMGGWPKNLLYSRLNWLALS